MRLLVELQSTLLLHVLALNLAITDGASGLSTGLVYMNRLSKKYGTRTHGL